MNDTMQPPPTPTPYGVPPRPAGPGQIPPGPVPPTPPPIAYGYPPPRRRGLGGMLMTISAVFTVAIFCFFMGLYTGLLSGGGGLTESTFRDGTGDDRIVIIPIRGFIDNTMVEYVRQVVDEIIEDETIRAVIIRVESGGGLVGPSDQIHHELQRLNERRALPMVASYGNVAASGGYYVSCSADRIFAEPTTLTGSIGVIGHMFTVERLLDEKLGITPISITSKDSPEKDIANNPFRKWTDRDVERVRDVMDIIQAQFMDVVAEGRKDVLETAEEVAALANGKAFMAEEAVTNGLVDEIGYIEAAITHAKQLGGISTAIDPPVVYYRFAGGLSQLLFGASQAQGLSAAYSQATKLDADGLRRLAIEASTPQLMYLYQP